MAWIVLNSVEIGNAEFNVNSKWIAYYYASVVPVDGTPQQKTIVRMMDGSTLSVKESPAQIGQLIWNW